MKDLCLSKQQPEVSASRLQQKAPLRPDTKVTFYRNKESEFLQNFVFKDDFVYCHNVKGIFLAMGMSKYESNRLEMFYRQFKTKFKVRSSAQFKSYQKYGAVPIGYSTKLNEEYENIKLILRMLKCNEHQWIICVNLKVVNFLLWLQSGYMKQPCFLCYWDSRDKTNHWTVDEWPDRTQLTAGDRNFINSTS